MTGWIRKQIRYAFWSLVISVVIMIFMMPQRKIMDMAGFIKQSKNSKSNSNSVSQEKQLSPNAPVIASEVEDGDVRQISSSVNEYIIEDQNYVLIEGKYYKASPDNIYNINGRRIYYVNNRHAPASESAPEASQGADASPPKSAASPSKSATSETEIPKSADMGLPTSPSEMMETLNRAQKAMKQRNEMLNQLENEK